MFTSSLASADTLNGKSYPDKEIYHEEDVEGEIDLLCRAVGPSFARLHRLSAAHTNQPFSSVQFADYNAIVNGNQDSPIKCQVLVVVENSNFLQWINCLLLEWAVFVLLGLSAV